MNDEQRFYISPSVEGVVVVSINYRYTYIIKKTVVEPISCKDSISGINSISKSQYYTVSVFEQGETEKEKQSHKGKNMMTTKIRNHHQLRRKLKVFLTLNWYPELLLHQQKPPLKATINQSQEQKLLLTYHMLQHYQHKLCHHHQWYKCTPLKVQVLLTLRAQWILIHEWSTEP